VRSVFLLGPTLLIGIGSLRGSALLLAFGGDTIFFAHPNLQL
jgi:hypothetical protein